MIWGLEELSDKELQERLWTGNVDGEMSSFVEAICSIFDDSGLGKVLDSSEISDQISSEVREKAIHLSRLVRLVPQSAAPLDLIQHPAMNDVRSMALELLFLLRD
ncbi:MAG: hypothetical protein ABTQ27_16100 [Amaricoccus sp.]|uniref:hypothetical protein n=1 Tax=Amaricoccus sp. TaxID=1872485 RepID=UPI0033151DFB